MANTDVPIMTTWRHGHLKAPSESGRFSGDLKKRSRTTTGLGVAHRGVGWIPCAYQKPRYSMVLVYLPSFTRTKSPSYVGKYTSTMVRIWEIACRTHSLDTAQEHSGTVQSASRDPYRHSSTLHSPT